MSARVSRAYDQNSHRMPRQASNRGSILHQSPGLHNIYPGIKDGRFGNHFVHNSLQATTMTVREVA